MGKLLRKSFDLKLILIGIILNCLGRGFAVYTNFPGYLNVTGTIYSGYFGGPLTGIIVALISCIISASFIHTDIFFLVADLIFAATVYPLSNNNRYMERYYSVFSLTLVHSLIKTVPLTCINMLLFDGRTTLDLPNAAIDFLAYFRISLLIQYFVGAFLLI